MKHTILSIGVFGLSIASGVVVDFSTLNPADTGLEYNNTGTHFYNGADSAGEFSENGVTFNNSFTDFGTFTSWNGFSYSNTTDTTTPTFDNQYSSAVGGGFGGNGDTYALAFGDSVLNFDSAVLLSGAYFTNTTFALQTILNGNAFSQPFGGVSGDEPDLFTLNVSGLRNNSTVGTIEIILADYRFDDNSLDFILDDWEFTDLSSLGEVDALSFSFTSTDTGSFGINTPTYFALDNLEFTVVPEPGSTSLALLGTILALSGYRKRSKV